MSNVMRYKSTGEVHKDFHGLACATLHYLLENYGASAVNEVVRNTACNVYRTMRESIGRGDFAELEEFWAYYLGREVGSFSIERLADGIRLEVSDCPALRHLVFMGKAPDPIMCDATRVFNEALADGSPYDAKLERTGEFSCVQTFSRVNSKQDRRESK